MDWREVVSLALIGAGCLFFMAGTVGLLRFPDLFTRLHALTKADGLGLGLLVLGLMGQVPDWADVWKLLLIWMLAMMAGATSCHLVARSAVQAGVKPWSSES